jgi:hypothetical protein
VPARTEVRGLQFDARGEHLTFAAPDGALGTWDWQRRRAERTG